MIWCGRNRPAWPNENTVCWLFADMLYVLLVWQIGDRRLMLLFFVFLTLLQIMNPQIHLRSGLKLVNSLSILDLIALWVCCSFLYSCLIFFSQFYPRVALFVLTLKKLLVPSQLKQSTKATISKEWPPSCWSPTNRLWRSIHDRWQIDPLVVQLFNI